MGLLFGPLTDVQLDRVAQNAVRLRLKPGEALFQQGDAAKRFYLVAAGRVKLFRLSPAGGEKVIEVVSEGGTFGEALVFLEAPRFPVGAQALTAAEVISVDSADFTAMLRGSVDTCFAMMADMSQRLRALVREIDEMSQYSAACRLAAYLYQQLPGDNGSFELPVSKQVLASRLSIKPETFSRILKDLSTRGLISVDGPRFTVHDPDGLGAMADVCSIQGDDLASSFHRGDS